MWPKLPKFDDGSSWELHYCVAPALSHFLIVITHTTTNCIASWSEISSLLICSACLVPCNSDPRVRACRASLHLPPSVQRVVQQLYIPGLHCPVTRADVCIQHRHTTRPPARPNRATGAPKAMKTRRPTLPTSTFSAIRPHQLQESMHAPATASP
jgi:hypothetical protein